MTASSPRAVVAAAAPAAARIGASIIERGGNAYDAVVAAALAETVLLPPKCGLGGDLVAIAWHRDRSTPEALLAIGGAPAGLAEVARAGGLTETGPMSVGVPAAPAGYAALAERGVYDRRTLAAAAIETATDGFCWSTVCTLLSEQAADLVLASRPADASPDGLRYYPHGRPIRPGSVVALPGLARVLEAWVDLGAELMAGDVGRAVVDRVARAGGVLGPDDLVTARAEWVDPVHVELAGEQVWATPAPTHGPSLLDSLSRLGDVGSASPADVVRATRAAIEERRHDLTDPSGTSIVSAVDRDGTMVVVIHSHSYPQFGSGLVVEEYDLVLANRAGRGFTAEPGHPNFPVPGRRPATTLHAWALAPSCGWRVLGGTPGGASQMPWNAQTLALLIGRGDGLSVRDLATAVVRPRWEFRPDGGVRIEAGFDPGALAGLEVADDTERWALRSAMQIVADTGAAHVAVADPRTVGAVVPL
ncbi:MAG: gamma-glutamyltransferase [Ilumatobacteraceae bacterium]